MPTKMPQTTTPAPVPAHDTSHAEAVIAALTAAFPEVEIRRNDITNPYEDRLRGASRTKTELRLQIPIAVDDTRVAAVSFEILPPLGATIEGTLEVRGESRTVTYKLKAGEDVSKLSKKVVDKAHEHVAAVRQKVEKRRETDRLEAQRMDAADALRAEFPLAAAALIRLDPSHIEIHSFNGTASGCESGELIRVALAAMEAHLRSKAGPGQP